MMNSVKRSIKRRSVQRIFIFSVLLLSFQLEVDADIVVNRKNEYVASGLSSPANDGATSTNTNVGGFNVNFEYFSANDLNGSGAVALGYTGVFGGNFGTYATGAGQNFYWSTDGNPLYSSVQGYRLSSVTGHSDLSIAGDIGFTASNRNEGENSTFNWRLVYSADGIDVSTLDSGSFIVRANSGITGGGDTSVNASISNFNSGYVALWIQSAMPGGGGHINLNDNGVIYNFTTAVPEPSTFGVILLSLTLTGLGYRRRR